jgi:hypothetical protein
MTTDVAAETSVSDWHRTRLRVPLFAVDLGQAVYHGNYFIFWRWPARVFCEISAIPINASWSSSCI